jgi:hypothetical protein
MIKRGMIVVLLWALASIGCAIGGLLAWLYFILYALVAPGNHIRNVAEAQDRVLAAMYFGCTGKHTVSLEAAFYDRKHKQRLRAVRLALDKADPAHCDTAAINEHAYCRLRDNEPGDC